jgi:glycosyltransferase 2 family protein
VHSKKLLINLPKFAISGGILAWVVYKAQQDQNFAQLRDQPKHWDYLLVAFVLALAALAISFVRCWLLARALELRFRLQDAFRLGFLGYLLNFVSVGAVGGDLFKAVFIAREQHGQRTEAVASVIIDRLLGLYCLVLVAATGVLATPLPAKAKPIVDGVLLAAAVGAGGIALLMLPAVGRILTPQRFRRLPLIGLLAAKTIASIDMYRTKYGILAACCGLSFAVHSLTALSFYAIALSLPGPAPSPAEHFAIVPLGMTTGVLPLPLGALGALEGVMDYLYRELAGSHEGLIVTFGYRMITIILALVGACYYVGSRRDVAAAMHDAEDEDEQTRLTGETLEKGAG